MKGKRGIGKSGNRGGVFACIGIAAIVAVMSLQGCATTSGTQESSEITIARLAGAGLRVAVGIAAPQYSAPLTTLTTVSLAALNSSGVDLAKILGDTMALVTEISNSGQVDKYAQSIADVGSMFSGLIRLDWKVPEKYERAVAIARAFFEGAGK